MNFQRGRRPSDDPEINLIPLIDIFLISTIFVMLTTTFIQFSGLEINLPTADVTVQANQSNEIRVEVAPDGRVAVNQEHLRTPLDHADKIRVISEALRHAAGEEKDPVIIIHADANATHQSVISIMHAAQMAGYPRISFVTQTSRPD